MVKVSAPGSLMVAGEHAVLHGKTALVLAINHRLSVTVHEHNTDSIIIKSMLGTHQYSLPLSINKPREWQERALAHFSKYLQHGLTITIDSGIDPTVGLGSSAALISALFYALHQVTGQHLSHQQHWQACLDFLHQYQPMASGSDLAASHFGGLLSLDPAEKTITPLSSNVKWLVAYTGYKTKTVEVIAKVQPYYNNTIFQTIHQYTHALKNSLSENNHPVAGKLLNQLYKTQQLLHTNCTHSDQLWGFMQKSCYGAKLSGSGLGDCMIGIQNQQTTPASLGPYRLIHCQPTMQGLTIDD